VSEVHGPNRSNTDQRALVWATRYGELVQHVNATGVMPKEYAAPDDTHLTESRLAGWVRYQRRREAAEQLLSWQHTLLEQIPGFAWEPLDDQWGLWYAQLSAFFQAKGRVPRYRSPEAGERTLAAWVHKQRHLYRLGVLRADRVIALRQLPIRIV
jgi:hypothetical protein